VLSWTTLSLLLNILSFNIFHHFNSSSECFLEWLIVSIAYLSAFSNNTFVISIFLNNSLSQYSQLTSLCFFNSLCVLMFVLDNPHNHDFQTAFSTFLILLTLVTMPHEPLMSSLSLWTKIYELLFQTHLSNQLLNLMMSTLWTWSSHLNTLSEVEEWQSMCYYSTVMSEWL
jgi:hypothetical protein